MEPELKRLRRLLITSWAILIFTIMGFTFWVSYQVHSLKYAVAQISTTSVQGIKGDPGVKGLDGVSIVGPIGPQGPQGDPGIAGHNAVSVFNIQPIYTNVPVSGPVGPTGAVGKQGIPGKSARELELCKLADGSIGQHYVGDIECQPIGVSDAH